jgi:hypothetical protein
VTAVADLLCVLSRQQFDACHVARVLRVSRLADAVEWERVARIAEDDGVAPIVSMNLARCAGSGIDVPSAVLQRLDAALLENVALKMQRRTQVVDGLLKLEAVGYDALLLKSTALEALGVYRQPWVTVARDADMVLRIRNAGGTADHERAVRWALYTNGVECDRFDHHDVTLHDVVRLSFADIWSDARELSLDGARAWVPSPEDHLILLCINACRKRFFRLKSLFDIAESIASDPVDWDGLTRRALATGCGAVVLTALLATGHTVGTTSVLEVDGLTPPARRRVVDATTRAALALHARGWASAGPWPSVARVAGAALQYGSFSPAQCWRSARASLFHREHPPQVPAQDAAPGPHASL